MSARSSNSSDSPDAGSPDAGSPDAGSPDAGKPRSSADAELDSATEASMPSDRRKSLDTFEIEVSAGRSTQTNDKDLPRPAIAQPKLERASPTSEPQQTSRVGPPEVPDEPADELTAPVAIALQPKGISAEEFPQPVTARPSRPAGGVARQSSWWITSLGIHVLLLFALAFSTLAVIREERLELYASTAAYEPVEEFQDLEIDPSEDLDALEEALDEPDADTLAELSTESLMEEPTLTETPVGETAATDVSTLGDVSNLLGDVGTGMTGTDDAIGTGSGGGMVKFFGTEIKARRILYMLDNSGGMREDGKFESLVSELLTSVRSLDRKQQFYVIFYSDTVYPLFFPYSVRKFVAPSEQNLKSLVSWLDSVELCGGNAIDEALAAAEVIRPEAVFLLTDGDLFTTDKKKTLLLNRMGRKYAIHTFGLGVGEKTKTAARLEQVAEANEGTFRTVKITDEMKALAKEKNRPYHSKVPGPVWGIKVGER